MTTFFHQLTQVTHSLSEQWQPQSRFRRSGELRRIVGIRLEATGFDASISTLCEIHNPHATDDEKPLLAEVVGFEHDIIQLMPYGTTDGIHPRARVYPSETQIQVPVGDQLVGRVISAMGKPLDDKGALLADDWVPMQGETINPLLRAPIQQPLDVGIKTLNGLLTVGKGQRLGIFAGTGVGKSVLLGMMTKNTVADIVIVGLIGERGREVNEFVQQILGTSGLAKSIVVASPADDPPLMRLKGAMMASRLAEYFRDQGKQVLLLMDSLSRYAQAQRELALALGEPPATKGYPPSVFAKLPSLVERAGMGLPGGGSITAFYTVLAEGDDENDPVLDAARGVLDGHIVLSRDIAAQGRYPAIDVNRSVSRVMQHIVSDPHWKVATEFKKMMGLYEQNADLIHVGAYQSGSNPALDKAIKRMPTMGAFLSQGMNEAVGYDASVNAMLEALSD